MRRLATLIGGATLVVGAWGCVRNLTAPVIYGWGGAGSGSSPFSPGSHPGGAPAGPVITGQMDRAAAVTDAAPAAGSPVRTSLK